MGGPGAPPPRPPAKSWGFSIDLAAPFRKPIGKLVDATPEPIRAAGRAAKDVADEVERAIEWIDPSTPRRERRGDGHVRGCSVPCQAQVTGIADTPSSQLQDQHALQTSLLRIAVSRPDGPVELCVRQQVPFGIRGRLEPGSLVPALADPADQGRAVLDWSLVVPDPEIEWARRQFDWPPSPQWPAQGRIEDRDHAKYQRRMDERRATWTSIWARPVWISRDKGRYDGRLRFDITLELGDGRLNVMATERVPAFALGRISTFTSDGGVVHRDTRTARSDRWIPALTDGRDACIDWQGFFDQVIAEETR